MSFEGSYQIICKNGHSCECDCYEDPYFGEEITDEFGTYYPWKCHCGAAAAWWNLVDETNGSYCSECNTEDKEDVEGCKWCLKGRIDGRVELEVDAMSTYCVCAACGHSHPITQMTFKIPEKKGHLVKDPT